MFKDDKRNNTNDTGTVNQITLFNNSTKPDYSVHSRNLCFLNSRIKGCEEVTFNIFQYLDLFIDNNRLVPCIFDNIS